MKNLEEIGEETKTVNRNNVQIKNSRQSKCKIRPPRPAVNPPKSHTKHAEQNKTQGGHMATNKFGNKGTYIQRI